ncbi:SDR family oxidoreductase [Candidatus Binatia bacterium]|nr:SDR family oxidoreductase [Candidatus Binatia bacterium]
MTKEHGKRWAVVTGASSGIGEAFARQLAREGYDLTIVARGRDRLSALARALRGEYRVDVEAHAADLTDTAGLHAVERLVAQHRDLDLLVNNAGFGTFGRFDKLDVDAEENEIRLNVLALVRLTRAALPAMAKRKHGAIVNVSSLAAFQPGPFNATYAATKAYVNSFTEALHEELRGTGVYVQALCPGLTRTEFQDRAGIDASSMPDMFWMSPEDVVGASLAAMRKGELICVPGLGNRMLSSVTGALPRAWVRRAGSELMRRVKK